MNLRAVILPAKKLADGSHKVRIAISHNSTTRYFTTRFVIPDERNIINGQVVGLPNSHYINSQISKTIMELYTIYDTIEDSEYLTCSQLVCEIEERKKKDRPRTLEEACLEYLAFRKTSLSESSYSTYQYSTMALVDFFGKDKLVKSITPKDVTSFKDHLLSRSSNTTVKMRMTFLTTIIGYMKKHCNVKYDVDPFTDVVVPRENVRNCHLSIEQIRAIRDADFSGTPDRDNVEMCRNFFMLSFFLCGMNLIDILKTDLTSDIVSFKRQKNASRKKADDYTSFTIQDEARHYINLLQGDDGKLGTVCGCNGTYRAITCKFSKWLPVVAKFAGIEKLIYYSARKSFAQIANELMIKDSIIEYCIGDAVHSRQTIGFYVSINRRMADKAIRKVFDAVASTKSIEELVDENM